MSPATISADTVVVVNTVGNDTISTTVIPPATLKTPPPEIV